ncbi:lytic murein transglycosylase [Telmatospirillum siberiense]|uniref:Lytic murein transglycosylase n=2 Tax=Telmatospirillum siberiense TaxID=382514 RepID=A0A2N3PSB4_9PROT|nr:lytic murein transglycosylase [Telmatospirillum siberiense]
MAFWRKLPGIGAAALWLVLNGPALADQQEDFSTWLGALRNDVLIRGISQATVDQALKDIQPIDRVLELDRRQPEFSMTFEAYRDRVVTPARVADGQQILRQNKALLAEVSRQFGVPPRVLVAMTGIESNYGRNTGGFSVVPALATLAYDGRRSQYFRTELINALKIIDRGMPAQSMQGSWAGAMGQCQFMPSTYLKYARKWKGEGTPDIWRDQGDVFASAANYLSQIGWKGNETWGRPVLLPKHGIAEALIGLDGRRSLKEWNKLGLRQANGKPLPPRKDIQASLIRAETGKGDDVGKGDLYLVYDNFRVLLKWNRSIFFALAAGTLADRLESK